MLHADKSLCALARATWSSRCRMLTTVPRRLPQQTGQTGVCSECHMSQQTLRKMTCLQVHPIVITEETRARTRHNANTTARMHARMHAHTRHSPIVVSHSHSPPFSNPLPILRNTVHTTTHPRHQAVDPMTKLPATWLVSNSTIAAQFSATCYLTARHIDEMLWGENVPIGLICE